MDERKRILEVQGVSKSFPGVHALTKVNFDLYEGEVHALVGENGAGKSTLIKIIAGICREDEGLLRIDGLPRDIQSVDEARKLGISVIFQELSLISTLTIAENVFLGNELCRAFKPLLDRRNMERKTREIINEYNIDLNPREMISEISIAKRQMTEIVKALSANPRIIIMDEPTSSLTDAETKILFRIIAELKLRGVGVVYVSHRMDEIVKIADRVSVLRDGFLVGELPVKDATVQKIVNLMVGREVTLYEAKSRSRKDIESLPVKLEVKNFCSNGHFKDVSFKLLKGEILGIAGLVGSGRSELMRAVFGIDGLDSGELYIDGKKVAFRSAQDAIKSRISLLPEDRKVQGLFLIHNLMMNITLPVLKSLTVRGLLKYRMMRRFTRKEIERFDIKPGNPMILAMNLSGGNQQKVCISKCLATQPEILIVDEPTVGIDVRTKSEIHKLLRELSDKGVSIIMVSSEMEEVIANSDRLMLMNEGHVVGTFFSEEMSQDKMMSLIMKDAMRSKREVEGVA